MQYQHTKRELEMAELIEGSERDRRRLAELLDGIRVGPGVDAMADGMREAVWADVRSRIRRRGIRMRIVRYAAAAAVMAGVVCGSWFMGGRRTESRLVAAAQPVSVSTPLGVKSDVVLPDGSRVRLNGGTRIVYPALFGDERRVEVDGEAYFEVEHDARRPFVVVTGQVVSTVLGTTFNVHAYSEDENYQITLATGSLLVDGGPESRSVRLRPGEQGFFERTSGLLSLRRVNVEQVLSWQEDRLYFRAEPLASIDRGDVRRRGPACSRRTARNLLPHRCRLRAAWPQAGRTHAGRGLRTSAGPLCRLAAATLRGPDGALSRRVAARSPAGTGLLSGRASRDVEPHPPPCPLIS